MAIQEAYENLARFNPEQHWLTFEQKWDWNLGRNVVTPMLEDKPTGIIGYIILLVYEYIWKPESLTLESVVPHVHSFIVLAQDLQERGNLQLDQRQMHETAEKIYRHFFYKCQGRRDLYRANIRIFTSLQRFQGQQAVKLDLLRNPEPPSFQAAYVEEIATVAARHRLTRLAFEPARGSIVQELDAIPGLNTVPICDRLKAFLSYVEPQYNRQSFNSRRCFSTTRLNLTYFKEDFQFRVLSYISRNAPNFRANSGHLDNTDKYQLKAIACMVRYFDAKMAEEMTRDEETQLKQEMTLFLVKLKNAFEGCVNLRSTAIENLYYDICAPDQADARMRRKSQIVLEGSRRRVRDHAITSHLRGYADHASSMNYYRRRLNPQMGISRSLSDLDDAHFACADQGKDQQMLRTFRESYTTEGALNDLLGEILGERGSGVITADQFREWALREQLGGNEERLEELIFSEDDARWHPEAIAKMLVQLGLFAEVRSAGA